MLIYIYIVCVCVYIYIYVHIYVCIYIYISMYVCMYVTYIYIYIYICTYVHAYTYIYNSTSMTYHLFGPQTRLPHLSMATHPVHKPTEQAAAVNSIARQTAQHAYFACSASQLADLSFLQARSLEDVDPLRVAIFRSDWTR